MRNSVLPAAAAAVALALPAAAQTLQAPDGKAPAAKAPAPTSAPLRRGPTLANLPSPATPAPLVQRAWVAQPDPDKAPMVATKPGAAMLGGVEAAPKAEG